MELYRSGHNGAHSKCVSPPGHVGSNPTNSVIKRSEDTRIFLKGGCSGIFFYICNLIIKSLQIVYTVDMLLLTVFLSGNITCVRKHKI